MSIIEIAKKAGVSKSTVSRVLNHQNGVSPQAATSVKSAIKKLNYQIPLKKRGPKRGKNAMANSINIALLDYTLYISDIMLKNSLFNKAILSIEKTVPLYNMNLIVAGQLQIDKFPEYCQNNNIKALIIVANSREKAPEKILELSQKIPTVFIPKHPEWSEFDYDYVTFDNSKSGKLATEYFLKKGHKNMAFLNIAPGNKACIERGNEFKKTALSNGANALFLISETNETDFLIRQKQVDALIGQMLQATQRVTGIFIASAAMAIHVYNSFKSLNIAPMKDIDIIICDNIENRINKLSPKPIVIDTGFDLIGEAAVNILNWKLNKPNCKNRVSMKIDPIICEP